MQLKQFYDIATKVRSRKSATTLVIAQMKLKEVLQAPLKPLQAQRHRDTVKPLI